MVNGSRFASEPASLSARESQIPELPRSRSKQVADYVQAADLVRGLVASRIFSNMASRWHLNLGSS